MRIVIVLFLLVASAISTMAQERTLPEGVTHDEVNAIAEKLYCPVCENQPLDTCGTTTCVDWREEIALQLSEGRSNDEIVAYFVTNYGDRVVGVPQESSLQTLSFIGPILVLLLAIGIGITTFLTWRSRGSFEVVRQSVKTPYQEPEADDYRNRLENDLKY